jgi:hypothetical protein
MKTQFASNPARRDRASLMLLLGALSIAIVAVAVLAAWPPAATVHAGEQAPAVGVFTGESEPGIPVYRLPPVTVSAQRADALEARARDARGPRSAGVRDTSAGSSS